jgi:hypothetical protein
MQDLVLALVGGFGCLVGAVLNHHNATAPLWLLSLGFFALALKAFKHIGRP